MLEEKEKEITLLRKEINKLEDLIEQADYWARQRGAGEVDPGDVAKAVNERRRRFGRVQSKVIDAIKRETLLIDTSGECVGQVNGLSVTDLGEFRYGHPVRITATTRVGTGDVVDIERRQVAGDDQQRVGAASSEPGRDALEVFIEAGTILVDRELAAEFLRQPLLFGPLPHDDNAADGWRPRQRPQNIPRHRAREHRAALAGQYIRQSRLGRCEVLDRNDSPGSAWRPVGLYQQVSIP